MLQLNPLAAVLTRDISNHHCLQQYTVFENTCHVLPSPFPLEFSSPAQTTLGQPFPFLLPSVGAVNTLFSLNLCLVSVLLLVFLKKGAETDLYGKVFMEDAERC